MDSSDLLSSRRVRIKANNYNNQKATEYPNKMPRLSSQDLIDIKRGIQEVSLDNGTIVLPACGGRTCSQDVKADGSLYPIIPHGWYVETIMSIPNFYPTSIDFDSAGNVYYAGYVETNAPSVIYVFVIYKVGNSTPIFNYNYSESFHSFYPSIAIDRTNSGTDYIYTFDINGTSILKKLTLDVISSSIVSQNTINITNGNGTIKINPGTTGNNVKLTYGSQNAYYEIYPNISSTPTQIAGTSATAGYDNNTNPINAKFRYKNISYFDNFSCILIDPVTTSIYISDCGNNVIRFLDNNNFNSTSTFVGANPTDGTTEAPAGFVNGNSINAKFNTPTGLSFFGTEGNIIVADTTNNAFRTINTNKDVNTIGYYSNIISWLPYTAKVDGALANPLTTFSRPNALTVSPFNPNIIYFGDNFVDPFIETDEPLPNIRRLIYYP